MMKRNEIGSATVLNVLFIGNSFTARNNLPGLIARLAAARGRKLEHQLINRGGASLRMHWNKGEAQQTLAAGDFDYVVLQEQSTLGVKNAARMHENIRLFDKAIKDAGAQTVLYLTWAREHEPHNQQIITDAYTTIGAELGAKVVPVGIAWQEFLATNKAPALHDPDKSHPTLAGSYLAACVFLSVLFNESPAGIESDVKGLTAADVSLLQTAAQRVVT